MRKIGIISIAFSLGVVVTLFLVTADQASWFSRAESSAPELRSMTAEDVLEDPKPFLVITDSAACVQCCVPVRSVEQEPCMLACVYDAEIERFRYLRPSDVLKE